MKQIRLWSGTIAALMVAMIGIGSIVNGVSLVGVPLLCIGLGFGAWQGAIAWRKRPDPYDLSRLWDEEPGEPDEDGFEDRNLAYCHICGQAVAAPYARCPDCGNTLR